MLPDSILKYWDYSKNTINPLQISYGSKKKAWWICDNGHSFECRIDHKANGTKCAYCYGRYATADRNITLHQCFKEWNFEKNQEDPITITPKSHKKVWWKCSNGHEWQALVSNRTKGIGCPYCSGRLATTNNNLLFAPYISEFNYLKNIIKPDNVTISSGQKLWWKCTKGHEWQAAPADRTGYKTGCPLCALTHTQLEKTAEKLFGVQKYNKKVLKNANFKPDLKINDKIYINLDGLYWHSELSKHIKYHVNVRRAFAAEDKKILQFYQDEIYQKPLIVKSIVDNILGLNKRIFARKCKLYDVKHVDANKFLKANHLIGEVFSSHHFGLYFGDELVMVLSYQQKRNYIEIVRVCTKIGYSIVGGLSRLISALPKFKSIKTIIDLRYATGESFLKLGFKVEKEYINYQYTDFTVRVDKREMRVPAGVNEKEEAAKKGWHRIWDAGKLRLVKES